MTISYYGSGGLDAEYPPKDQIVKIWSSKSYVYGATGWELHPVMLSREEAFGRCSDWTGLSG